MGQALTKQWKTISDDASATMAAPTPTRHIRSRSSSFAVLTDLAKPKTRPKSGFAGARGSKSADSIKRTLSNGHLSAVNDDSGQEFSLRMDARDTQLETAASRGGYKDVQARYEDWAEHEKRRRQAELARQKAEVELVLKRTSILSLSMAGKAVQYETAAERKRREAREWAKRNLEERLHRDCRTFGSTDPSEVEASASLDPSWTTDFDFDEEEEYSEESMAVVESESTSEPSWEDMEPADIIQQRRVARAAAKAASEAEAEASARAQASSLASSRSRSGGIELVMDMTQEEYTGDFGRDEIVHTVQPQDTLQGLGLRYSVPAGEIERVNLLHSNEELHIRDYVIIPTSREIAETMGRPDEKSELEQRCIALFMDEMNCRDERLAERYLRRTGFSVQEAIGKFLFDQAKHRAFEHRKVKEMKETGESFGPSTGGMTFVLEGSELHMDLPDDFIYTDRQDTAQELKPARNDRISGFAEAPATKLMRGAAPQRRIASTGSALQSKVKRKPSSKCD